MEANMFKITKIDRETTIDINKSIFKRLIITLLCISIKQQKTDYRYNKSLLNGYTDDKKKLLTIFNNQLQNFTELKNNFFTNNTDIYFISKSDDLSKLHVLLNTQNIEDFILAYDNNKLELLLFVLLEQLFNFHKNINCDISYVELYNKNVDFKDAMQIISMYVVKSHKKFMINFAVHLYIVKNIEYEIYTHINNTQQIKHSSIILHSFCANYFDEDIMTTLPIGNMDTILSDYSNKLITIHKHFSKEKRKIYVQTMVDDIMKTKKININLDTKIIYDIYHSLFRDCSALDMLETFLEEEFVMCMINFKNEWKKLLNITGGNFDKYIEYKTKYFMLNIK